VGGLISVRCRLDQRDTGLIRVRPRFTLVLLGTRYRWRSGKSAFAFLHAPPVRRPYHSLMHNSGYTDNLIPSCRFTEKVNVSRLGEQEIQKLDLSISTRLIYA